MTRKKKMEIEMKIVTGMDTMLGGVDLPSKYKKWLNEQKAMIDYVYVKLLLII